LGGTHPKIWDDHHYVNLVRITPSLRPDIIFGPPKRCAEMLSSPSDGSPLSGRWAFQDAVTMP
jgi:hypothetical protein